MRAAAAPLGLCAAAALLLLCTRSAAALDNTPEGLCTSMDIRNTVDQLMRLRGCRIIEGQLRIVLMEKTNVSSFEKISFPELREVTGYVLFYRLRGVRNLGDFFPNLTVIRGLTLYKNFALVVYDNKDLQAIGLRSLVRIERGNVRVEANDKLCFTNTVDWNSIVPNTDANVIRRNYDTRLCGKCSCGSDPHCWDEKHCQRQCPHRCETCTDDSKECCHAQCLGGCDKANSTSHCHACRNLIFHPANSSETRCVEKCPEFMFQLMKRCVTKEECWRTPVPYDGSLEPGQVRTYKIFEKYCLDVCPEGYMESGEESGRTCVKCPEGVCLRQCEGGIIDSVDAAQRLHGCTHISASDTKRPVTAGSIEIALKSAPVNIIEELETNLGSIREIQGYLKVTRAMPLISLSFLKNLKRIKGQAGNGSKVDQALHIFSNPNLELLWNWTTHGPIEIEHGKLFIHLNPKLCYHLIAPLKNMTRETTFTDLEVSEENNGDRATCYPDAIDLHIQSVFSNVAVLHWNNYCQGDSRKLLGYFIYYIPAKANITTYESRDACRDNWSVQDKPISDVLNSSISYIDTNKDPLKDECQELQPVFHMLSQLTPFTRYAVYVKTYTPQRDRQGAQSPIVYFRTLPGRPSPPRVTETVPLDPHSVMVKWQPPEVPNCDLDFYLVQVHFNSYNEDVIRQLNYCSNPTEFMKNLRLEEQVEKKKYQPPPAEPPGDGKCSCKDSPPPRFNDTQEDETEESINFENSLQNDVYVKIAKSRIKRSFMVDKKVVLINNFSEPNYNVTYKNVSDDRGYVKSLFLNVTADNNNVTLENLRHYSWYTVSVFACRGKHPKETRDAYDKTWCSMRGYDTFRTTEMLDADIVTDVRAEVLSTNKTLPEVMVTWKPPPNPNGHIVAYNIYHVRQDSDNQAHEAELVVCVSAAEYGWAGGAALRTLPPGNYSVRVAPVSVRALGHVSTPAYAYIPERYESKSAWAWGVGGGLVVLGALGAAAVWLARRNLLPPAEANKLFASVNPEYVPTVYIPDEWEVPRDNIKLVRELGQGSFGMVYEGLAKNIVKGEPETRCAVKTVNEHATDRERVEFLQEASVMKAFDTWHVVRLLGVVSRGQPTLVVMELMAHGDLKSYLRARRDRPPALEQTYQMAIEIADGMAYLSAKKFVHRDLAARNCMVSGDLTVKVGDFGMTRDIYETDYYRKGSKGLLPVRWMSPESLKDGVFSSNSDVWSYGVVLWEMATLAMQPYQGLSNEQVLRYVVEGGVMERPEHCPDRLYEVMRRCWAHRAAARPPFLALVGALAPLAAPAFRHRAFFHTPQGQQLYHAMGPANFEDDGEASELNVGAVATGSGSNLFGVSGRLASWVRELSSLRSRASSDAAAQPLAPPNGRPPHSTTPC